MNTNPWRPNVLKAPKGAGDLVVYLDFDGVLHHENCLWNRKTGPYLKAPPGYDLFQHAPLLEQLLDPYPQVKIVLSTSWVRSYGCTGAAKRLPEALRAKVIGATFHSRMNENEFISAPRGMQVWGDTLKRLPADWIALDDDYLHWPKWCLDKYVKTHEHEGISYPAVLAELQEKLALMCANADKVKESAMSRPILFLDFDDVLCLNDRCGGYDAINVLGKVEKKTAQLDDFKEMWSRLFSEQAKKHLTDIHNEFNPIYVLSTSWTLWMNRAALATVLRQTGLGFVADNLHLSWQTPNPDPTPQPWGPSIPATRAQEIALWRQKHPEHNDRWVVLDDVMSGIGLKGGKQTDQPFVVLCEKNKGLTQEAYERLQAAFRLRKSGGHS